MAMNLDEIFKAYDIRGRVPEELDSELAAKIGRAFADWLPAAGPVAVGRDMRPDSAELSEAFIEGLLQQGREVWDIGQITSDMVYFAVGKFKLAGGAVVTASHNDAGYNGIKLYRDQVLPVGLDGGLAEIRDQVRAGHFQAVAKTGQRLSKDISEAWIEHTLSFIDAGSLASAAVAIDAGNGMAGAILPAAEAKLPLSITRLYYELDGSFPNHPPNPMDPANLKDLAKAVVNNKLDFGIAFDGDGDRAMFVDDTGAPVGGSVIIALLAQAILKKHPNTPIVYDVRTSRATVEAIEAAGGVPVRAKAGRTNIGPAMREHQAIFGGETTGHLFFRDNYYADSGLIGALVAAETITASGRKLSELVRDLAPYATAPEQNFAVDDKQAVLKQLAQEFSDGELDWLDGLTVNYDDWWFNIRPSNTEPVIKLNIEASKQELLDKQLARIRQIVKT